MRNFEIFIMTLTFSLLSGCAVTGGIQPVASSKSEFEGAVYGGDTAVINKTSLSGEEYRVFNQGSSSFVSLQANIEDAEARANKFCIQKGKVFRPLRETTSRPPHILGNFPRVELIFECVENASHGVAGNDSDRYVRLAMLKKLFDDGTLTKEEFEQEKEKILRQQ